MKKFLLSLGLLMVLALSATGAGQTTRIRRGATLPPVCDPAKGEIFFRTATDIGIHHCTSINTWTFLGTATGAPSDATYITQTSNATLSAEQALDGLASGIMRSDTAAGVITTLTTSADIAANISDIVGNAGVLWRGTLTSPAVGDVLSVIGISPTVLGNATLFMTIANEGVTGTTVNHFVKLTGAPSTAIISSSGDAGGMVGVCVANCGTTGDAEIQVTGIVQVDFDGSTTAGNYVENSNSVDGEGTDAGSSYPTTEQVLCRVTQTIGAAGLANCLLFPGENRDIGGGGGVGTLFVGNAGAATIPASLARFSKLSLDTLVSTEANVESQMPAACTMRNLRFTTADAQPASGNLVLAVRIGGSDSAVTITVAASAAAGDFSDLVNTASVSAGDRVSYHWTNNATDASAQIRGISVQCN